MPPLLGRAARRNGSCCGAAPGIDCADYSRTKHQQRQAERRCWRREEADVEAKLYRHYKGGLYRITGDAVHSETGEELVLYQAVDGGQTWARPTWARPAAMFFGAVEVDGQTVRRFEEV